MWGRGVVHVSHAARPELCAGAVRAVIEHPRDEAIMLVAGPKPWVGGGGAQLLVERHVLLEEGLQNRVEFILTAEQIHETLGIVGDEPSIVQRIAFDELPPGFHAHRAARA